MKCPKCGYLGFEPVERCRNCGYDFSLTEPSIAVPDLLIRHEPRDPAPLDDLSFVDAATAIDLAPPFSDARPDREPLIGAPAVPAPGGEWMLFGPPTPDDEPLITSPSPPRPPLAVRRATPEAPRLRKEAQRRQSLDLALEPDGPPPHSSLRTTGGSSVAPRVRAHGETWPAAKAPQDSAPVIARALAVVLDLLVLAAVDVVVVYFTIQICGLSMADVSILPKVPLIAFLLAQNVGYLVAFTAGGQTLGKMAAGIRVVPAESGATLDLGRACLRTLMWLVLAVPAGLGFLTAVLSDDHRGLHDRFAGTRVVRASA
jgi:uncharacterized RDD family membrane protein YckC